MLTRALECLQDQVVVGSALVSIDSVYKDEVVLDNALGSPSLGWIQQMFKFMT